MWCGVRTGGGEGCWRGLPASWVHLPPDTVCLWAFTGVSARDGGIQRHRMMLPTLWCVGCDLSLGGQRETRWRLLLLRGLLPLCSPWSDQSGHG